ncbi:metal-dependent transcriptional regulator [Ferroacidibacillus organovorans]|uniref:Manganese transport regulator n=1 Tax=Ferroacidibacillus organovorans TaxID=1765683 RepID=A0A101XRV5_9BACL|nr:metal-dependent transcriptional regulator [Ferroacidibacillus organovorans]KUO96383.1 hypothetical protein ATW55_03645 [Ferroacidibacillus organovorans]
MKTHHTSDTYIEAIYVLSAEGGVVIAARLAEFLHVSRPTVTQMIRRLTDTQDVYVREGKEICLTEKGLLRAEQMVRRHRILERWLSDVLGLDWGTAHIEASRLEHAISPLLEERLEQVLGYPKTCPHGNLIPGSSGVTEPAWPLSSIEPEQKVRVVRIFEQAEEDVELLRYLESTGFVPGQIMKTLKPDPYDVSVRVEIGDQSISISTDIAERILVAQAKP